ncbi:Frag1/DRAM/Sfk1 [Hypoxylon fragiforme]|uniref:Frag1/DRAM/Sfk1 n=1 Tax=Hypoxylon fragiforme TaxID=63214 RepID=UPI0020C6BC94|nr:Frag1/DRAM/Sfk1 [Hypoxylon fragiforme]KAI2610646.1 Frag1/DRAM/Sfk1 [Hypoxylon fragiforme]
MARPWYRAFRDFFSIRRLWLFPLLAGSAWFITLTILLVRWLVIGRPQYPGQVNPYVPFISDIAAHQFKPVFIVGCVVTGVTFVGTMFAVHHVRYSPQFYKLTDDALWRQITSLIAEVAGMGAAVSLINLSVFDTADAHVRHRHLLMGTFGGLFVSAITTTAVWWDQICGPTVFVGLRKWCMFNTFLVLCQFGCGLAFVILMYGGYYKSSGILEWCLTYLGSFWLASFVGYTMFREGEEVRIENEDERQPLLV